jgi:hypothetical protein
MAGHRRAENGHDAMGGQGQRWKLEISSSSGRNETRMAELEPVIIVISRDEVEARDVSAVLKIS